MITSKHILHISENWVENIKGYDSGIVPIYENPGSTDMRDLNKSFKLSSTCAKEQLGSCVNCRR